MKILIGSYLYAPSIGGIETMSALMAAEFRARGHNVRVVTLTANPMAVAGEERDVLRRPSPAALRAAVRDCEVYWQNNCSLELLPLAALWRRRWVVTHQTWLTKADGRTGWRENVKRLVLRRATGVAISRAVAAQVPKVAAIIPNCYDDAVFSPPATEAGRDGDLVFVGRLVSDKGADGLIDALALLAGEGLRPKLTLIGAGPEQERLQARVAAAGLAAQVRWTGALQGAALAAELRRHRVQVVPSRWAEPFGIVALEGAACGCVVLGSKAGGLPEAIGPCGGTFANQDVRAMADLIAAALAGSLRIDPTARAEHLRRHRRAAVADAYLRLFAEVAA